MCVCVYVCVVRLQKSPRGGGDVHSTAVLFLRCAAPWLDSLTSELFKKTWKRHIWGVEAVRSKVSLVCVEGFRAPICTWQL